MMRNLIFILVTLFSLNLFAAFACDENFKQKYVNGKVGGVTADKLYNFKKMRDELITEIESSANAERMTCLTKFYESTMSEAGQYWGKRVNEESCGSGCKQEFEKSKAYLTSLDKEFKTTIAKRIQATKSVEKTCEVRTPAAQSLEDIRTQICCGKSTESSTGAVRGLYPEINYQTCLGKITPTKQIANSVDGALDCVANMAKTAIKTIFTNIKSIFTLPFELFEARDQIWQVMTNMDAMTAFVNKVINGVKKYVSDRVASVNSCLNNYEQGLFFCHMGGEIIGTFATPGAIAKVFKFAKAGLGAGSGILTDMLSQSDKGKKVLDGLAKAAKKTEEGIDKVKDAKNMTKEAVASAFSKSAKAMADMARFAIKENPFTKAFNEAVEKFSGKSKATASASREVAIVGESPVSTGASKFERAKADAQDLVQGADGKWKTAQASETAAAETAAGGKVAQAKEPLLLEGPTKPLTAAISESTAVATETAANTVTAASSQMSAVPTPKQVSNYRGAIREKGDDFVKQETQRLSQLEATQNAALKQAAENNSSSAIIRNQQQALQQTVNQRAALNTATDQVQKVQVAKAQANVTEMSNASNKQFADGAVKAIKKNSAPEAVRAYVGKIDDVADVGGTARLQVAKEVLGRQTLNPAEAKWINNVHASNADAGYGNLGNKVLREKIKAGGERPVTITPADTRKLIENGVLGTEKASAPAAKVADTSSSIYRGKEDSIHIVVDNGKGLVAVEHQGMYVKDGVIHHKLYDKQFGSVTVTEAELKTRALVVEPKKIEIEGSKFGGSNRLVLEKDGVVANMTVIDSVKVDGVIYHRVVNRGGNGLQVRTIPESIMVERGVVGKFEPPVQRSAASAAAKAEPVPIEKPAITEGVKSAPTAVAESAPMTKPAVVAEIKPAKSRANLKESAGNDIELIAAREMKAVENRYKPEKLNGSGVPKAERMREGHAKDLGVSDPNLIAAIDYAPATTAKELKSGLKKALGEDSKVDVDQLRRTMSYNPEKGHVSNSDYANAAKFVQEVKAKGGVRALEKVNLSSAERDALNAMFDRAPSYASYADPSAAKLGNLKKKYAPQEFSKPNREVVFENGNGKEVRGVETIRQADAQGNSLSTVKVKQADGTFKSETVSTSKVTDLETAQRLQKLQDEITARANVANAAKLADEAKASHVNGYGVARKDLVPGNIVEVDVHTMNGVKRVKGEIIGGVTESNGVNRVQIRYEDGIITEHSNIKRGQVHHEIDTVELSSIEKVTPAPVAAPTVTTPSVFKPINPEIKIAKNADAEAGKYVRRDVVQEASDIFLDRRIGSVQDIGSLKKVSTADHEIRKQATAGLDSNGRFVSTENINFKDPRFSPKAYYADLAERHHSAQTIKGAQSVERDFLGEWRYDSAGNIFKNADGTDKYFGGARDKIREIAKERKMTPEQIKDLEKWMDDYDKTVPRERAYEKAVEAQAQFDKKTRPMLERLKKGEGQPMQPTEFDTLATQLRDMKLIGEKRDDAIIALKKLKCIHPEWKVPDKFRGFELPCL